MTQRNIWAGPIPGPDKRREVMAAFIAEVEANSDQRAFSASNFPILDGDLQMAELGHVLGVGCQYYFYQLDDGKVITTVIGDGPWPYASVAWVWGEVCRYEEALIRVALDNAIEGGGWKPEEVRAMVARTMAEVMPSDQ